MFRKVWLLSDIIYSVVLNLFLSTSSKTIYIYYIFKCFNEIWCHAKLVPVNVQYNLGTESTLSLTKQKYCKHFSFWYTFLSVYTFASICLCECACMYEKHLRSIGHVNIFSQKKKSANRNSNWFSFIVVLVLFHWGGIIYLFFPFGFSIAKCVHLDICKYLGEYKTSPINLMAVMCASFWAWTRRMCLCMHLHKKIRVWTAPTLFFFFRKCKLVRND